MLRFFRTHFQLNQEHLKIKTRQRSLFLQNLLAFLGFKNLFEWFGGGFVRFKFCGFLSKQIWTVSYQVLWKLRRKSVQNVLAFVFAWMPSIATAPLRKCPKKWMTGVVVWYVNEGRLFVRPIVSRNQCRKFITINRTLSPFKFKQINDEFNFHD